MSQEWYDEKNNILWEQIRNVENFQLKNQEDLYWDSETNTWWYPSEYQYVSLINTDIDKDDKNQKNKARIVSNGFAKFSEMINNFELHPELFTFACKTNNIELVRCMVPFDTINLPKGAAKACKKNNVNILRICLEQNPELLNHDNNKLVYYAVKKNHLHICQYLLSLPELQITTFLLQSIINKRLSHIVYELVLHNYSLLFSILNENNNNVNECLYFFAIQKGLYDAYLLISDFVEINTNDDYALYLGCKYGRTEIVTHLLDERLIDPCLERQYAFETACKYGHVQIVKKFLQNKEINVNLNNDNALCLAVEFDQTGVIRTLIENGNFVNSGIIEIYYLLHIEQIQGIFGSDAPIIQNLMHSDECGTYLEQLLDMSNLDINFVSVCLEICWKENKIDAMLSVLKHISKSFSHNMSDTIMNLYVKACKFNIPIIAKYLTNVFNIELSTHSLSEILPEIGQHDEIEEIVLDTKFKIFDTISNANYFKYVQFIQGSMLSIAEDTVKTQDIIALRHVLRNVKFNTTQLESLFVLSCKEQNFDAARVISVHLDKSY